jgi:hypothetical protein
MNLLGRVDEEEEQGERAGCGGSSLEWQLLYTLEQLLEVRCPRLAMSPGAACPAEVLDCLELLLPFQSLDRATQRSREPADVFVKRKIFRTDFERWRRQMASVVRVSTGCRPAMTEDTGCNAGSEVANSRHVWPDVQQRATFAHQPHE